jgi:hypothetical protein
MRGHVRTRRHRASQEPGDRGHRTGWRLSAAPSRRPRRAPICSVAHTAGGIGSDLAGRRSPNAGDAERASRRDALLHGRRGPLGTRAAAFLSARPQACRGLQFDQCIDQARQRGRRRTTKVVRACCRRAVNRSRLRSQPHRLDDLAADPDLCRRARHQLPRYHA